MLSLPVVQGHEVACDSQHQQSALGAGRRTKINSSNPPLTAARAACPAPPFLPVLHPPVELAGARPGGYLNFTLICLGKLLQIIVGKLHV